MDRKTNRHGEPFGAWLLVRAGEAGPIGSLAAQAAALDSFRPAGTVDDLRAALGVSDPDKGVLTAIDEAEIGWLAY